MKNSKSLYLIPTPLAEDTVHRVLPAETIERITDLRVFFVENVKSARRFISSLKKGVVIDELTIILLDKRSTFESIFQYLTEVNENVGVLSEAGCPGVADPGAIAADAAHQLGWNVVPLVGPSSILLALMASGFNGQSFVFHGYLPIDRKERNKKIKELERAAVLQRQTQIFMETPYRNLQMFESLLQTCHPDTRLSISADLTSSQAFSQTRSISSWSKMKLPDIHKKPAIFILG